MNKEIEAYNDKLTEVDCKICYALAVLTECELPEAESKIWHGHPVWFLDGNPIVGYSKQKAGLRLMFWSGASFEEEKLNVLGKKFKDASIIYTSLSQLKADEIIQWLKKSREIQWDYKNIVKKKGQLDRIRNNK